MCEPHAAAASRLRLFLFYTPGRKFSFHASLTFCPDSAKSGLALKVKPGGNQIDSELLLFGIPVWAHWALILFAFRKACGTGVQS